MATTAIRDGDDYIVNGSKTFITNGINADLVIVAAKTDPTQRHSGMSLLVVERGMPGFERGRNLEKIGLHGQDTAELFFDDVRVPWPTGSARRARGSSTSSPTSPRSACRSPSPASRRRPPALTWTLDYVKERTAFGQPIADFQNTRFVLAEMTTEVDVAQAFVDQCVRELNAGDARRRRGRRWPSGGAPSCRSGWSTGACSCFGGYGYMLEYPIARAYADARVTTIYGGTTEIMKEIIAKSLGV